MKNIFALVVLAIVFSFGCWFNSATPLSESKAIQEAKTEQVINLITDSTVSLQTKDIFGSTLIYCAGIWISAHKILTANHCVQTTLDGNVSDKVKFKLHKEVNDYDYPFSDNKFTPHDAEIISSDSQSDLSVLAIREDIPHSIVSINTMSVQVGQKVHILGHPGGMVYSYFEGSISHIRLFHELSRDIKIIQISGPIWKGNSGGGAFNEKGELIGLCSFIRREVPNMAFFISYEEIMNHLVKNKIVLD